MDNHCAGVPFGVSAEVVPAALDFSLEASDEPAQSSSFRTWNLPALVSATQRGSFPASHRERQRGSSEGHVAIQCSASGEDVEVPMFDDRACSTSLDFQHSRRRQMQESLGNAGEDETVIDLCRGLALQDFYNEIEGFKGKSAKGLDGSDEAAQEDSDDTELEEARIRFLGSRNGTVSSKGSLNSKGSLDSPQEGNHKPSPKSFRQEARAEARSSIAPRSKTSYEEMRTSFMGSKRGTIACHVSTDEDSEEEGAADGAEYEDLRQQFMGSKHGTRGPVRFLEDNACSDVSWQAEQAERATDVCAQNDRAQKRHGKNASIEEQRQSFMGSKHGTVCTKEASGDGHAASQPDRRQLNQNNLQLTVQRRRPVKRLPSLQLPVSPPPVPRDTPSSSSKNCTLSIENRPLPGVEHRSGPPTQRSEGPPSVPWTSPESAHQREREFLEILGWRESAPPLANGSAARGRSPYGRCQSFVATSASASPHPVPPHGPQFRRGESMKQIPCAVSNSKFPQRLLDASGPPPFMRCQSFVATSAAPSHNPRSGGRGFSDRGSANQGQFRKLRSPVQVTLSSPESGDISGREHWTERGQRFSASLGSAAGHLALTRGGLSQAPLSLGGADVAGYHTDDQVEMPDRRHPTRAMTRCMSHQGPTYRGSPTQNRATQPHGTLCAHDVASEGSSPGQSKAGTSPCNAPRGVTRYLIQQSPSLPGSPVRTRASLPRGSLTPEPCGAPHNGTRVLHGAASWKQPPVPHASPGRAVPKVAPLGRFTSHSERSFQEPPTPKTCRSQSSPMAYPPGIREGSPFSREASPSPRQSPLGSPLSRTTAKGAQCQPVGGCHVAQVSPRLPQSPLGLSPSSAKGVPKASSEKVPLGCTKPLPAWHTKEGGGGLVSKSTGESGGKRFVRTFSENQPSLDLHPVTGWHPTTPSADVSRRRPAASASVGGDPGRRSPAGMQPRAFGKPPSFSDRGRFVDSGTPPSDTDSRRRRDVAPSQDRFADVRRVQGLRQVTDVGRGHGGTAQESMGGRCEGAAEGDRRGPTGCRVVGRGDRVTSHSMGERAWGGGSPSPQHPRKVQWGSEGGASVHVQHRGGRDWQDEECWMGDQDEQYSEQYHEDTTPVRQTQTGPVLYDEDWSAVRGRGGADASMIHRRGVVLDGVCVGGKHPGSSPYNGDAHLEWEEGEEDEGAEFGEEECEALFEKMLQAPKIKARSGGVPLGQEQW